MLKRWIAALLAGWLLLTGSALGEAPAQWISEILAEQITLSGQRDLPSWIQADLTESADGIGGWYLIALRWMGALSAKDSALPEGAPDAALLAAREALEEKAAQEGGSITKRERMALTLQALSSSAEFIRETVDAAEEENTLMPLVFALHLMNNDPAAYGARRAEIADRLIALQLEDGGWAVMGEICDVDCTAMTLQALAPLRSKQEAAAAIDRGIEVLSRVQQENGGFLGMGMESAESSAQALLALSSLGIDPLRDERFVKNGNSVLDSLARFRIPGEGFAHDLKSGQRNDTATVQCFYALMGYEALLQGEGPYYVFDFAPLKESPASFLGRISPKAWLMICTAVLVLAGWLLAAARRKRNWRSYVFPLLVGLALIGAIIGIEIQSPEAYYSQARAPAGERNQETLISIRCDSIAGENEYAPADGVILAETTLLMAEGETAFDQLLEATRSARIQMEYDGTAAGAYVRSIGYLYEYAFGNLSGWMYRVNGVFADVGCSQYRLSPGDRVEWVYTRNLGRDE